MTILKLAPGRAGLAAHGRALLWTSLRGGDTGGGGDPGGGGGLDPAAIPPSAISGLSGWWDASSFANTTSGAGSPAAGWGLPIASVTDLSGGSRPATRYSFGGGSANSLVTTPRLAGLLGGVGFDLGDGVVLPKLDQNLGLQINAVPMGAGVAWTRLFVWTRPNWRTNMFPPPAIDGSANTLLSSGGVPVLRLDGASGSGRLILFPTGVAAVLSSAMTRRHTHTVILQNVPGVGVSAWLDGVLAVSAVANPISGAGSALLLHGHDGAGWQGGAQCWFHEFACWERGLSSPEMIGLLAYAKRWKPGARKGVQLLVNGQSNANYATQVDGAGILLARTVAWWLGCAAYGQVAGPQNSGGPGTIVPGIGIYDYPHTGSIQYASSFLIDPHSGSDPSTWSRGKMGDNCAAYISALSAEDQGDIAALIVLWSETDSYRPYSELATFKVAATRWLALLRAMVPNATPANLPVCWWASIPFGNTDGVQMHREVVAQLASDATQNVVIAPVMTADSNSRSATWSSTTGVQSGGDNQHRDGPDEVIFARRAAPIVARALYATGRNDAFSAIPAGLPVVGGPRITHAWLDTSSTVVLTIQHDAGTDLIVPLLAASGAGFLVMDGGSVAAPGGLVPATACNRIDATHLRILLSRAVTNAPVACLLFYPYGSFTPAGAPSYRADMGRGNAVTDNFAAVAKPAGWDIGADLGSAFNINYPLAATTIGMPLSAGAG